MNEEADLVSLGLRKRNTWQSDRSIRDAMFEPDLNVMPLGVALALPHLLEHVRQLPQKVESGQRCSCYCSNSNSQDIETGMRSMSSTESSSVEDLTSFGGSCSDESISSPLAANPNNNPSSSPSPSASPPPASSTYQPSCHRCRSLLGRRLILSLCEIHACILEVDEALIDENLPSELLDTASIRLAVASSRNWLERLQSFVMSLQRDVEAFMQQAVRSRLLTVEQHSAVQELAWQALLHTMVQQVDHAMGPGSGVFPPSPSLPPPSLNAAGLAPSKMTPEEAVATVVMSHFRANVGGVVGSKKGNEEGVWSGGCAKRKGGQLLSYRVFWAGKVSI